MTQPLPGPSMPMPDTWPITAEPAADYQPHPRPDVDCFPIAVDPALKDRRRCQYCGDIAEVFDIDGAWCSDSCQRSDRGSEVTYWRKAVAS